MKTMADLQTDTIYVVELVVTPTVLIRGKFLSLLIKKRKFFSFMLLSLKFGDRYNGKNIIGLPCYPDRYLKMCHKA